MEPREIIRKVEESVFLPAGRDERFSGYTVVGLPFQSGHILALRRFPASSVGAGYTSVWHRSPSGDWTFYSTVRPEQTCARYFGGQIRRNVVGPIDIIWTGPAQFRVRIGDTLKWDVTLTGSLLLRFMNAVAPHVPQAWWQTKWILKLMAGARRIFLGTGRTNLSGKTPNGYEFVSNPRCCWLIDSSRAVINGVDIGSVGRLKQQAGLDDFLIPQRGIFAVEQTFMKRSNTPRASRSLAAYAFPKQRPRTDVSGFLNCDRLLE